MYRNNIASKDILMTALAAPVVAIIVLAVTPAQAQTYDPKYPVCLLGSFAARRHRATLGPANNFQLLPHA
jgi:hypothetical protein